ncbi:MAG: ubiquinone biosynthesis hydroxylase [Alphaproteobacteria bacterium]
MKTDVLIAGGGVVGMALAVALRRSDPGISVTVVDRGGALPEDDGRAWALAAAVRQMLEALNVWHGIADVAEPIREMVVTDSGANDVLRGVFLTFSGVLDTGEPFAHMVPNAALRAALAETADQAGVQMVTGAVEGFERRDASVLVKLLPIDFVDAKLLVAADGSRSQLRDIAGIGTTGWDYGQVGLVGTIRHEKPHFGVAQQNFLPEGPFAVLPLQRNCSSLVWTESRSKASDLVEADPGTVNREIRHRIGTRLGEVEIQGGLQAFPLRLSLARDLVKPRFCLVGDSAHTIHPLAGQGLNLGLRDVAALSETIVDARRLGLDFGELDVLERYQSWRRFDVTEMGVLTDGLNRLFSNDNTILRFARDIGLGMVDRLPKLKREMVDQAAGLGPEIPRLLRGEAI